MSSKKIRGITIQIGGDTSGLTKALSAADKSLAATNRELAEVQKGLKLDPHNVELMSQKQQVLTNAIAQTADKLKLLEGNQEKAKKAFAANADWEKQYAPLKEQIDKARKSLNELKSEQEKAEVEFKAGKISAEDFEKIKARTAEAEQALKDLKQQKADLEKQFADGHITAEEYRAYQREVENTRAELNRLQGEMHETGTAAETSTESIKKFSDDAKSDFKAVVKAAAAITAALLAVGKQAVETGAEFDSAMSQVAATMGYSVEEINTEGTEANKIFNQLRDYAQQMGKTTAFSANSAAEALNYLALSGKSADESIQMLPGLLNLASAGNMELAKTSDVVTDAQSALGLSIEDTEKLIDQMAKTASKSNTSVEQLGEGILNIGATAKDMRGGTKELTEVLGLLADSGIKSAEGGTKLRNILLKLEAPTEKAAAKLEELGVKAYDSDGKLRSMQDIFTDLNAAMADMTEQDKSLAKAIIFNARDLGAVNALLNTSVTRWNQLGDAIEDSAGAAQDMAEVQLDNLAGDVTLFKSALEGAEITISDRLTPSLRNAVQFGTEMVGRLADGFGKGGLAGAVEQAHKVIAEQLGEDAKLIYGVEAAVEACIGAFMTYKATMLLSEGIAALKTVNTLLAEGKTLTEALNAAAAVNPYVLIATAAIGAGIAIKKLIDIQTDLIDEAASAYDLLDEKQKETVDGIQTISQEISDSRKAFKDTRAEIKKQADSYRLMADKLYELNNAQVLNGETRDQMRYYADQLNGAIKGLNIELDGETGRLKTQKETVDALIDSYEAQAKAQAAQQHLAELYGQQIEAELSRKKALDEVNEAEKKLLDLTEKKNIAARAYNDAMAATEGKWTATEQQIDQQNRLRAALEEAEQAVKNQKDIVGDLQGSYANAGQALANVNRDIDACKVMVQDLNGAMDDTADSFSEDADTIADKAEEMGQAIAEGFDIEEEVKAAVSTIENIIKKYDDKLASRTGTLQSWFDVNATVSGDDAKFKTLKKNLDQQIADMETWSKGIAQLEDEGINQNFLDKLKDAGPQSLALVKELLNVPEKERNAYADKWYEAYQSAADTAEKQLAKLKEANEKTISGMIADLEAKSPEFRAMWEALGGDAIDGYIDGLRDGTKLKELQEAVKEMVDAALEATAEEQDSASPSKKAKKLGTDYGAGYVEGVEDETSKAVKAAKRMVNETINATAGMGSSAKLASAYSANAQLSSAMTAYTAAGSGQTVVQQATLSKAEITAAVENALKTVSGDFHETIYLDSDVIARNTYKKIDVMIGEDMELTERGAAR